MSGIIFDVNLLWSKSEAQRKKYKLWVNYCALYKNKNQVILFLFYGFHPRSDNNNNQEQFVYIFNMHGYIFINSNFKIKEIQGQVQTRRHYYVTELYVHMRSEMR